MNIYWVLPGKVEITLRAVLFDRKKNCHLPSEQLYFHIGKANEILNDKFYCLLLYIIKSLSNHLYVRNSAIDTMVAFLNRQFII